MMKDMIILQKIIIQTKHSNDSDHHLKFKLSLMVGQTMSGTRETLWTSKPLNQVLII